MLEQINESFRKVRNLLGKLPFLKRTKANTEYTMTEEVEVVTPQTQEQKDRRARIKNRTHRYVLNRSDRRFLSRVLGEDYPAGSKTTKVLWERVQTLKRAKLSIHKKRQCGGQFLLTGGLYS